MPHLITRKSVSKRYSPERPCDYLLSSHYIAFLHIQDEVLAEYLAASDRTYAAYQNPRGYFASATGWSNEAAVAPSTAWHSHDLLYLVARYKADDTFWTDLNDQELGQMTSVLLGNQCIWMERQQQWTITNYYGRDIYQIIGLCKKTIFWCNLT